MMNISVAFSSCPNDVFIFYRFIENKLGVQIEFEPHIHDISDLNIFARQKKFDVTKLSFPAWFRVKSNYTLLKRGAAIGFGCGPLVVAKKNIKTSSGKLRIAIPGIDTTAEALFRLWHRTEIEPIIVSYDCVADKVISGEADMGILIHEERFLFKEMGLIKIIDLGEWWEEETGLPVPLAGIFADKKFSKETIEKIEDTILHSLESAKSSPKAVMKIAKKYSVSIDEKILKLHIETFVTGESFEISSSGLAAIEKLGELMQARGLLK